MTQLQQLAVSESAASNITSISQGASTSSVAPEDLNDRYADSILRGCQDLYDALEVQGVRDLLAGTGASQTKFEVDNANPQQFSVYAHYTEGGCDAVGDFGTYALAIEYARELATQYDWPVRDYVLDQHKQIVKLQ